MQDTEAKRRKLTLARKDSNGLCEVHAEAYAGNLSRLGSLYLEHKINFQTDPLDALQRSPLHYACLAGNVDCIRYLVDQGADIHLKVLIFTTEPRLR